MGILTKTVTISCPVCGRSEKIKAPRYYIVDPTTGKCQGCGTQLTIMWTGSKYECLVCPIDEATDAPTEKKPQYNVDYWKQRYGDDWEQAHDEWQRRDDLWWETHGNR